LNELNEQAFSGLEELLSLWKDAYQCAVISFVGLKTTEGPRLLFGRIVFESSRIGVSDTKFRFETEHIIAERSLADASWPNILALLGKVKSGGISGIDKTETLELERDKYLSVYFDPIYHPLITEGPRLPSLRISGSSKHNLFGKTVDSRRLDWELKAAQIPFDSLDDLLIHCGLPALSQMGDLTTLELVARTPAFIGAGSTIMRGKARIECRIAAALNTRDIRIGYKIFHEGSVARANIKGSKLKWRREKDIKIGVCRVPVGAASLIQAFLSYKGVALHQWWIADPQRHLNPRHVIHQVFDKDLELLRKILSEPESGKDYAFEGAVSMLFNLLGFSIVNYGRIPKLQRGPDIIAVTPLGNIDVIECTLGLLDENDKLAKLVQRTTLINEKLTLAGFARLQVQPIIITPRPRQEITVNLEDAGKHNIAVICKENIEGFLAQASLPPNTDKLFDEIKRLVPDVNDHD
jgi:hypothetical protein